MSNAIGVFSARGFSQGIPNSQWALFIVSTLKQTYF